MIASFLHEDRLVLGTVEEVTAGRVNVSIGETMLLAKRHAIEFIE